MTSTGLLRIGIVGTDTSHVTGFARLLNAVAAQPELAGARVVAAVPCFSDDIPGSLSRHAGFESELAETHGVRLVESIGELCQQVDALIIHSIDGRKHRVQLEQILPFGKPVFVDKPFAASLSDAVAMFDAAERVGVPVFSSSVYRFYPSLRSLLRLDFGRVLHVHSVGPCHLESSHPDLFWYGIHAAEALFTVLGPDCVAVTRTTSSDSDVVTGLWACGATGTLLGLRGGPMPHGVTVFGTQQTAAQEAGAETAFGAPDDYSPLVVEIVRFFRTGIPPVSRGETLALFAFLDAAERSKAEGRSILVSEIS
jgi:predicted dehydrogenase